MKRLALLAFLVLAPSAAGRAETSTVAIVTAEQQNEVLAVSLPSGTVRRRVKLPADPENVAVGLHKVVVASPDAGAVTLPRPAPAEAEGTSRFRLAAHRDRRPVPVDCLCHRRRAW